MIRAAIPCLLLVATLASGCALRGHSQGEEPDDTAAPSADAAPGKDASMSATDAGKDQDKDKIFFAPVALGPLATIQPDARSGFAKDLASRLVWKDADVDGEAPEHLPASDAQEWKDGSVPAAADATLVVLTTVLTIDPKTTPGTVQATVEMRALDPSGAVIFDKKAIGHASSASGQGLSSAEHPEGAAAWDACTTLVGALSTVLEGRATPAVAATKSAKVAVEIDSDPAKATITIDGVAAGTTPAKATLSGDAHTISIALDGYDTWQKSGLVPTDGMIIQPQLHKTGAAVVETSVSDAAAGADTPAAPAGPQPTRAQVDPTAAPPTPDQLVVPGDK